jgi:hypothetical protein
LKLAVVIVQESGFAVEVAVSTAAVDTKDIKEG